MRRIDKRQRRPLRMYFVLCAAGTIAMLFATWVTFVSRPADYETLRTRGVLTTARPHCKADNCTLTYAFGGRTHENRYGNAQSQFQGIRPVPVLVDPQHPATMFTVHDVEHNTNAGLGVFGVFCLLAGAGLAFATFSLGRALRRFMPVSELRPEPPASLPESSRAVLLAIDATEDVLHDLPRPDSVELAGAISHLRERLAAVPRIDPSLLDVPERLSRRAREAKRLDPEPLHEELAQLRWRVAARAAQL